MIQSAITLSLVPELKGGPFVFSGDLAGHCAKAARLGFDAVELFIRSAEDLNVKELRHHLSEHNLKLAAIGTGPGWVVHKLRLTDADPIIRHRAQDYIAAIITFAGAFGAPAIVGSMQGTAQGDVSRERAWEWLREALEQLGPRAHVAGVPLLFEPLNRYESNLVNTLADGMELLRPLRTKNVKLLCDLYHMNIEEANIADSLRKAGSLVGHVHFSDSNRRAMGFGHTDVAPVAQALRDIEYSGFISAEVLPLPDSDTAAEQTIKVFPQFFRG